MRPLEVLRFNEPSVGALCCAAAGLYGWKPPLNVRSPAAASNGDLPPFPPPPNALPRPPPALTVCFGRPPRRAPAAAAVGESPEDREGSVRWCCRFCAAAWCCLMNACQSPYSGPASASC